MFRNKDSVVFWTAMAIAAFELLPAGVLGIPDVTAAPSQREAGPQGIAFAERAWPVTGTQTAAVMPMSPPDRRPEAGSR